jgi:hypothetical protein
MVIYRCQNGEENGNRSVGNIQQTNATVIRERKGWPSMATTTLSGQCSRKTVQWNTLRQEMITDAHATSGSGCKREGKRPVNDSAAD